MGTVNVQLCVKDMDGSGIRSWNPESGLDSTSEQEHEKDGTEQDAQRAHCGNHDLCDHLHVARQRI